MEVPMHISFVRRSIAPILDVKYESMEMVKSILISNAMDLLKDAEKFHGRPYDRGNSIHDEPDKEEGFTVSVKLSLIFPSEDAINSFIAYLNKS